MRAILMQTLKTKSSVIRFALPFFGTEQSRQQNHQQQLDNRFLCDNIYTALSTAQELVRREINAISQKMMGHYDHFDYSNKQPAALRNQLKVQLFSIINGMKLFQMTHGAGKFQVDKTKLGTILRDMMDKSKDPLTIKLLEDFIVKLHGVGDYKPQLEPQTEVKLDLTKFVGQTVGITQFMGQKEKSVQEEIKAGRVNYDPVLYGETVGIQTVKTDLLLSQQDQQIVLQRSIQVLNRIKTKLMERVTIDELLRQLNALGDQLPRLKFGQPSFANSTFFKTLENKFFQNPSIDKLRRILEARFPKVLENFIVI